MKKKMSQVEDILTKAGAECEWMACPISYLPDYLEARFSEGGSTYFYFTQDGDIDYVASIP